MEAEQNGRSLAGIGKQGLPEEIDLQREESTYAPRVTFT